MQDINALRSEISRALFAISSFDAIDALEKKISLHLSAPNCNESFECQLIRAKQIGRLISHIKSALKYLENGDRQYVKNCARKFLRAIRHEPIDILFSRGSKFRGVLNKHGRKRNVQKAKDNCRSKQLDRVWSISEITTVETLQELGHALQNCLAHNDDQSRIYHDHLRQELSEFYAVYKNETPYCLIDVQIENRYICEAQARNNRLPRFPRHIACEILEFIRANGDDEPAFMRVGAFTNFLGDLPDITPIKSSDGEIRVWRKNKEFLICRKLPERTIRLWSKFEFSADKSLQHICGTIGPEDLLYFVLTSKDLCRHLAEYVGR